MPFVFEQPNLDNPSESHLYFDPGDGRLITIFTNQERVPDPRRTPIEPGCVHHVAFCCDDIVSTVAKLRANGVRFVPISPNYYDDLPTRFELAPSLVTRMQELGILYDRFAGGEYFHIYTEAFAERFFFEIVQRVGDYDAYGALNAPARMASQAQAR